ncbi:MAG: hypothetical protein IPH28_12370 [Cytophagaceae bacterium]|nr:hypothetical protein [Cytophagaceae bacterium]
MALLDIRITTLLFLVIIFSIFHIVRDISNKKIAIAKNTFLASSLPLFILITIGNWDNKLYLLISCALLVVSIFPYFKFSKNQLSIPSVNEEKLEDLLDKFGVEKLGIMPDVTIKYYRINSNNLGFKTLSLPSWLSDSQISEIIYFLREKRKIYQKADISTFYKIALFFVAVIFFVYKSKNP